jgi:peptidoglycan/LPS O-acetylase OafA/YrhL
MILFMVLIGTARCKIRVRLAIEALLITLLFYVNRWDVALFIAGMATAELNLIAAERQRPGGFSIVPWVTLVFGWYLTGFPLLDQEHTPGYSFLSATWANDELNKWRFWLAISGILVVSSLSFLPIAQRAFTTRIARYLGKISYALYLVHPFMNATLRPIFWSTLSVIPYGHHGKTPLTWGWLLSTLLYIPCVLWVADVFWRLVDVPAVKFAKWVEGKCFTQ